jgi:L-iditol 2-dehydrogenase
VTTSMKALVVRAPMQFGVEDVPVPEVPDGGFLAEVLACAMCGSDLRTLRIGHRRVTFPWILGHEASGRVVELGHAYQGPWKKGDRLAIGPLAYCGKCDYCLNGQFELCPDYLELAQAWPGGFAEYLAVPEACVRFGTMERIPGDLDPAFAAISEPVASCINAQEKGQVGLGDTVLIIGAGPVGAIHICLARARGADRIYVADIVEDRLKLIEAFGPDATINSARMDLVEEVRRLTGGRGPDVIVTATPAPVAPVQAVEMARKGGRILLFGGLPKTDGKPGVDLNTIHYNALHLIGSTIFAPRHYRLALKLVASGRIPGDKLITHRFPLTEFNQGAGLALEGKVMKAAFFPGS